MAKAPKAPAMFRPASPRETEVEVEEAEEVEVAEVVAVAVAVAEAARVAEATPVRVVVVVSSSDINPGKLKLMMLLGFGKRHAVQLTICPALPVVLTIAQSLLLHEVNVTTDDF